MKRLALLAALCLLAFVARAQPAVAFYYGAAPPWNELQAFDLVVVDPGHVPDPALPGLAHTRLAAYVAVGEVQPARPYAAAIPGAWLVGENRDWGSRLIDQAAPGWPDFFAETVVGPLWAAGYRDFFLDTLDSYHLFAKTAEARARQEAGLVAVIKALKRRYPQARLIFNRGFEILDRTHGDAAAIAAESLFQGYDAGKNSYRPVAEADRAWLLGQLGKARDEYRLPVIAIDYVPPGRRELARATAKQIEALGFIPWVATPDLATLGVGLVEVMPRRILMVHSPMADEYDLRRADVVRIGSMPLHHLGYLVEYADPAHLPERLDPGLYAGAVMWFNGAIPAALVPRLATWLDRRVDEGMPLAFINELDMLVGTKLGHRLGIGTAPGTAGMAPIRVMQRDAMVGFERAPLPHPDSFQAVHIKDGRPLLTLAKENSRQIAAAVTPWGGYVMFPYAVVTLPHGDDNRWVIDPFAFFRAALRLPDMPVPDVTTESGRRLLMVHMDGDGFVSRTELPGRPFAGEVLRDRVVGKYALPMTLSVIEAELAPDGLYPRESPALEAVAREIFRAPHVEIASHSYSHPFNWRRAGAEESGEGYNLAIPGYRFNLQREIEGSIRYIESRLAPPGKKVAMFLWTGDCIPGRDALEWTRLLGVMNMNGGDTVATRSRPTLTQVEGLGVERNGLFQVFAPNQNENVYTNNWTGPFYGFERVIETFDFTENPRRLKPIDIYFHTYLVSRRAGLASLDKVFNYALARETTPVFASAYAAKVLEFPRLAIARGGQGWRIRGGEALRTLRAPAALGRPDLSASAAVAGYNEHNGESYIHLAAASAELAFTQQPVAAPRLVSANARIESAERTASGWRWQLAGQVPLSFTLADTERCRVRAAGRDLAPARRDGNLFHYRLAAHAARPLEAICGA